MGAFNNDDMQDTLGRNADFRPESQVKLGPILVEQAKVCSTIDLNHANLIHRLVGENAQDNPGLIHVYSGYSQILCISLLVLCIQVPQADIKRGLQKSDYLLNKPCFYLEYSQLASNGRLNTKHI